VSEDKQGGEVIADPVPILGWRDRLMLRLAARRAVAIAKEIRQRREEKMPPTTAQSSTKKWAAVGAIVIACLQGVKLRWPEHAIWIDPATMIIGAVTGAGVAYGVRNAIAKGK